MILKLIILLFPLSVWGSFVPQTFHMNFEQVIKSSLTGKENRSKGELDYQYPGKVRFDIKGSNPVIYVSNREKSWYYTPPFIEGEPGQLSIKDKGDVHLSKVFDRMKYGLKDNKFYKVKSIDEKTVDILFEKKSSKNLGVKSLRLSFENNKKTFSALKSLELVYTNDKKVLLNVLSLKESIKFESVNFEFNIPPNTKVVQ